jgi:hypothetical protein
MCGAYQRVENRITESTQNVNDLKSAPLTHEAGMTGILVCPLPDEFADGFFAGGGVGRGIGRQN